MFTDTPFYLGLLLFLAAALGWLAAKLPLQKKNRGGKPLRSEYFKGLNFLLAEKPDKALEVFIRMVEVDSDTVETHFALGSLFRRRGEVDRAIRVHQNLIARPSLSRQHKLQALFALGEDYMKAGLLDRAENLFLEMSRDRKFQRDALNHLVSIYEQQKDWDQAISVFRQLESATGEYRGDVIAHYYCELAEEAINNSELKGAQKLARKALSFDRNNGRPNIIAGDVAMANGKRKEALKHYRTALEKNVQLSLEVLPKAYGAAADDSPADFEKLVSGLANKHAHASTCIAVTSLLHPEINGKVMDAAIMDFLNESDQLRNLHRMFKELGISTPVDDRQSISRLKQSLRALIRTESLYRCEQCGYTGSTLHWQCPSCRQWNSMHPFLEFTFSGTYA